MARAGQLLRSLAVDRNGDLIVMGDLRSRANTRACTRRRDVQADGIDDGTRALLTMISPAICEPQWGRHGSQRPVHDSRTYSPGASQMAPDDGSMAAQRVLECAASQSLQAGHHEPSWYAVLARN